MLRAGTTIAIPRSSPTRCGEKEAPMTGRRTRLAALVIVTMLSFPALAAAQGTFPGTNIPIPQMPEVGSLGGIQETPWELPPSIQMPSVQQAPGGWAITFPGYPSINLPAPSGIWGGQGNVQGTPWELPPGAPVAPSYPPNTNGWNFPTQPVPTPTPLPGPAFPMPLPGANPTGPTGRVVGVFAGITNYPSGALDNCADDARRLAQAFVSAGIINQADIIVLTDQQASRGNVMNAIQQMNRRMPADGTLVFFFSGHGDRQPDTNSDERDGMDETIILSDGALTDDELTNLLHRGPARDLVALDTCYAGGFRDDVARLQGSVGYYSSGENETSHVAGEFGAGGYLSHFMRTGIEQSRGRSLNVSQLGQHIQQGYRSSGANGRQNLVIGTGRGVSMNTALFQAARPANAIASR